MREEWGRGADLGRGTGWGKKGWRGMDGKQGEHLSVHYYHFILSRSIATERLCSCITFSFKQIELESPVGQIQNMTNKNFLDVTV